MLEKAMSERDSSSYEVVWIGLCVALLLIVALAGGFGWFVHQRANRALVESMYAREMAEAQRAMAVAAEAAAVARQAADAAPDSTGQPVVPELYLNQDLWRHVDALPDAGPDDRVFTIDADSGELRFGDGVNGAAPPTGAVAVQATYRTPSGGTITVFLPAADLSQARLRASHAPDGTVRLELTDQAPAP
jgi:uncharacterized iron-regulated membrane protein